LVVLSLFVPLCISTGGNSGSQAATLITRALALGEIRAGQWWRVFRHELAMGILLGITLGLIGTLRGAATPESTRDASHVVPEPFQIQTPTDAPLELDDRGRVIVPKDSIQTMKATIAEHAHVALPQGRNKMPAADSQTPRRYDFPANCIISTTPVNRWQLAIVIGQAVAAICLWGTIVGSMLPMVFRRMGIDPGYASSPFVATFVDVTGIVIYFNIAQFWLGL
jgi:magnesium transporter